MKWKSKADLGLYIGLPCKYCFTSLKKEGGIQNKERRRGRKNHLRRLGLFSASTQKTRRQRPGGRLPRREGAPEPRAARPSSLVAGENKLTKGKPLAPDEMSSEERHRLLRPCAEGQDWGARAESVPGAGPLLPCLFLQEAGWRPAQKPGLEPRSSISRCKSALSQ